MNLRPWIGPAIAVLTGAALAAQQPAPGFRVERPIALRSPGPHRLAVDVPLLVSAERHRTLQPLGQGRVRADGALSDLRLFERSGREIPYLLIHPPPTQPAWASGTILPIAATEKTSGFEADLGAPSVVDAIRVDGLPAPVLKRLVLEGSGDRAHWTLLEGEGTVFDLPAERLRETSVPFTAGSYRYLRVTWDDTNSGRVPLPRAVFARVVSPWHGPRRTLTAEARLDRRPSEPGRSRYRLRLPGAGLPIVAVALDVGPGHVFRQATVTESRFGGSQAAPVELGRGMLARVERDGVAASALRIPIAQPREAELALVIEDGSNAPLDLRTVVVELAEQPWIYFEAPGGEIVARYGNPGLSAPAYDLEAARDTVRLAELPEAAWGEPAAAAPVEVPAPPMPQSGAPIDVDAFRHRRPIADSERGLVALSVDPAVLAGSRGPGAAFADVRIADESGHQVPYLLERRDEPISIDVTVGPASSALAELRPAPGRNRSVYAVTLPYAGLPSARLVLETTERVFRRSVQVGVERPADRRRRDPWFDVRAAGGWQHADQDSPPAPLVLPLDPGDATTLLLVIDEGDNRPLPIARARLLLPSWRLRFYKPDRPVRLLYGRGDLAAPRYDLALLAPQVMGAEAREIAADPADTTTAGGPPSFVSPRVFWVGLGVSVLVLLALIVRLVIKAG
jgi:hypothetical protein